MRTQVTLGKEELELLDRAAKASGASRSNSSDAQFTVPTGLDPSRNGSPRSTTAVARGEDGTSPAPSMSTPFGATSTNDLLGSVWREADRHHHRGRPPSRRTRGSRAARRTDKQR